MSIEGLYELIARTGNFFIKSQNCDAVTLKSAIELGEIKKVLIIQLQQLGDNLVFTPAVRTITENLSGLHISVLVNAVGYQVYKNFPNINQFYVDKNWFWGKGERKLQSLFKILAEIRKEKYDLTILDSSEVALKYPIIAFLTNAKYRLGFNLNKRGFLNTHVIDLNEMEPIIQANLRLTKCLGFSQIHESPYLPTTTSDDAGAKAILEKHGIQDGDKLILIHQGSNWRSKHWSSERWVDLCNAFLKDKRTKLFFSGTPRENEQVEKITTTLNRPDSVFSLVGNTSIHTLKAFIELTHLFITLDSGPMHIGNTTETKMLVLMSAIDKENRWIQPSHKVNMIRKEVPCKYCNSEFCPENTYECMLSISVDEVYDLAMSILS